MGLLSKITGMFKKERTRVLENVWHADEVAMALRMRGVERVVFTTVEGKRFEVVKKKSETGHRLKIKQENWLSRWLGMGGKSLGPISCPSVLQGNKPSAITASLGHVLGLPVMTKDDWAKKFGMDVQVTGLSLDGVNGSARAGSPSRTGAKPGTPEADDGVATMNSCPQGTDGAGSVFLN